MSEHHHGFRKPGPAMVLGVCTLWLLIQNCLLLLATLWNNPPGILVAAHAVAKASVLILARVWIPLLVALLGGVVIGYLYGCLKSPTEMAHD